MSFRCCLQQLIDAQIIVSYVLVRSHSDFGSDCTSFWFSYISFLKQLMERVGFIFIISSPEPWLIAELIVYPNFMWSLLDKGNESLYGPGHITKVAATLIYGKNKILFSRTGSPMILKLCMQGPKLYKVI